MRYRLLGRVEVTGDNGRAVAFSGNKERIVLAALLLRANGVASAAWLIDALWGEDPPSTAANALQVQVSRLRRKLAGGSEGGEVLRTEAPGYVLDVGPGQFDVARFEELVGTDGGPPAEVSARLREALALWRGPALADVNSAALIGEAARLDELRLVALERRVEADLVLGRHLEVVPDLEALVADQPLREGPRRQLMVALYRSGRQADALGVYRKTREVLADELGIDPSPALRALELAILNQSPDLDAPAVVGSVRPAVTPPSGTVTFVLAAIESSTELLQDIGSDRYAQVLLAHRERIRDVIAGQGGYEFDTEGGDFFIAFARASDALTAAEAVQKMSADGSVRVRIGVHTGEPLVVDGDYVGLDVHKAARICDSAQGGQVLVSQATADLTRSGLRDLGEYRLQDLVAPERLFQLGDCDFAPPRSLRWVNLPVQPTPLLGRQQELAELLVLARRHRLVTLTGPGGIGKTRLALQMAAELADDYPDGVWWAPLAAISDPALVLPAIAEALGVSGGLVGYLAGKRLLILLDNLEQVLEAAPRLAELLAAAPQVTVLVTSRERLALSGEQEYPVPPLDDAAAAELFATRARQVKPDFQPDDTVWEICRRLDQLPLALELASTRVKLMTTGQILARLERRFDLLAGGGRDRPPRQVTMRAAIDWSYDLLSPAERRVFRALGVFAGTFELEAAEAICQASWDELQSLVDKSLLRQSDQGRFYVLETTRQYALDRLSDSDETNEIRRRHAEWFLQLATVSRRDREAHGGFLLAPEGPWVERIRADTENFRTVLAWALEEDIPAGIQLVTILIRPWMMRAQLPELTLWFERALASSAAIDLGTRAWGLRTYGATLWNSQQHERAAAVLSESVQLFRQEGNQLGEALALVTLGNAAFGMGALEQARTVHERALAIFRDTADGPGTALALHQLSEDLLAEGQVARAEAMLDEAVQVATEYGDRYGASQSLHSLGDLVLDQRNPQRARQLYRESLAISVELGDERNQAYCLAGLACIAALQGEPGLAGWLWATAESAEDLLGFRLFQYPNRDRYDRSLARVERDPAYRSGKQHAQTITLEQTVRKVLNG